MHTMNELGSFKNEIFHVISLFGHHEILLVSGKASYKQCGAERIIEDELPGISILHFQDFDVNPKIEDAEKGAKYANEHDIKLILAVGGGSVLDMAKLIKAFMSCPSDARECVAGNLEVTTNNIPIIAVPTTAGSGSEATTFAVVYMGGKKYSLASPMLLPDVTILDGTLLASCSPKLRAINGLDALAQAIESTWAVGSTAESREISLNAVQKLWEMLPRFVSSSDESLLQEVMIASNLAGKSINSTKTTAAHAFSYGFTTNYGIPHGHAVWLTLPEIFKIHMRATVMNLSDRIEYAQLQNTMTLISKQIDLTSDHDPAEYLANFVITLGLQPDMSALGISENQQKHKLIDDVNIERLENNPVKLSKEDLTNIFGLVVEDTVFSHAC